MRKISYNVVNYLIRVIYRQKYHGPFIFSDEKRQACVFTKTKKNRHTNTKKKKTQSNVSKYKIYNAEKMSADYRLLNYFMACLPNNTCGHSVSHQKFPD